MSTFQSNFYQILKLDRVEDLTQQDIRIAYKKALLAYHPDKQHDQSSRPTVDDVALAYKVLSDRDLRKHYDQELDGLEGKSGKFTTFHTGLETIDLDDMNYDDASGTWKRSCRCTHGFVVTEDELEANAEDGELITGCRGCSLWLRVLYSTEG